MIIDIDGLISQLKKCVNAKRTNGVCDKCEYRGLDCAINDAIDLLHTYDKYFDKFGWKSVMDCPPSDDTGKCIVAYRGVISNGYNTMIAYWCPKIGKRYPFEFDSEYKDRKDGGWVVPDSEEDWELTGVDYYMKIPDVPMEDDL